MERIRRWLGPLICRLRGHDWERRRISNWELQKILRDVEGVTKLRRGTFWKCRRCPATRWVQIPVVGEGYKVQFFGWIAGDPEETAGVITVHIQTSWKDALGKLSMLANKVGLFTIELEMPRPDREGDWIPDSTWRRAHLPKMVIVPEDFTLGDVMASLCYPERGEEDAETE